MALLQYSFPPKIPIPSTWAFSSFYSVFLGFRGTNNFSLLPLRARAVTIAQELVFSFFFITSFFWCNQAESPQLTFYLQDPLKLLILAIWSSSLFQLFWLPSTVVIFPKQLESFTAGLKVLFQLLLFFFFFFFFISKKIILKKTHENIRQNREYREGNIKREKKRRKQEHKRSHQKTNYKEEN